MAGRETNQRQKPVPLGCRYKFIVAKLLKLERMHWSLQDYFIKHSAHVKIFQTKSWMILMATTEPALWRSVLKQQLRKWRPLM